MARWMLVVFVVCSSLIYSAAIARPIQDTASRVTTSKEGEENANPPFTGGKGVTTATKKDRESASGKDVDEKHTTFDKSKAGAEIMLGGLATAVFGVVVCYIKVTRRRSQKDQGEETTPKP